MGKRAWITVLAFGFGLAGAAATAQPVEVSYDAGLLTVRCDNATLSDIFESIESASGVELILEDPVKSKRLTADLDSVPLAMAVQRLLEGSGVNYAVMMNPYDWGRVEKIFLGAGGGGPARSAAPAPPRPVMPRPDPMENDPATDDEYFDDELDDEMEALDDEEMAEFEDDGMNDDPSLQAPANPAAPSYLPPQQSFPRSTFTPGPPSYGTQGSAAPTGAPFPYLDALGRPIQPPAQPQPPPDPQQQRQQQQQRQR